MPVKNNYQIKLYHGNSQARIFNFPFRCFSLDDLVVEYIDVDGNVKELVQNTEYSVRGGLDNSGGMIKYPLAPEELPLGPHEAIRISRCTPMSQEIDYPSYQQAIENALDKTAMIVQEAVGSNAIDIANEAVLAALEAVADVAEKVDRDGSNIDRIPFLSALKIGSSGEIDLSDLTLTDGSNADPDAFRSLVGMPEIEANISDVESELGSQGSSIINIDSRVNILEDNPSIDAIRPQTIVKGAVGAIPDGWIEGSCDNPAQHIITSGGSELTIQAGLQVAAGVEGRILLSNELESDTILDISSAVAQTNGTFYAYADIDMSGNMSFGYTESKPSVGLKLKSEYIDVLPAMTSYTSPEGYEVSAVPGRTDNYYPWMAFNKATVDQYGHIPSGSSGMLQITFPERYITAYLIKAPFYAIGRALKDWTISGRLSDGSWITIDSESSQTNWTLSETKYYSLDVQGNYTGFRLNYTANNGEPYTGIQEITLLDGATLVPDFYNTATHTHYNKNGDILRRVYLGEFEISSGEITDIINYQHGTVVTLPVNDGVSIAINSTYYLDKPFQGDCTSKARIYAEGKWGDGGAINYIGSSGYFGTEVHCNENGLAVYTALNGVCDHYKWSGGEFTTRITSALARVTVERSW